MPTVCLAPGHVVRSWERQWMWEALLFQLLPVCSQPPASPGKHPCPWCGLCARCTLTFPASQLPLQTPTLPGPSSPSEAGVQASAVRITLHNSKTSATKVTPRSATHKRSSRALLGHGCGRLRALGWLHTILGDHYKQTGAGSSLPGTRTVSESPSCSPSALDSPS